MTTEDFQMHALAALKSIDATLKELLVLSKSKRAAQTPTVDLDGAHGNPEIKAKDPRNWSGDTMRGKRFSECQPEYLRLLADRYDYFATQETDAKKANYNRLDAARARGWAARLENGWTAPPSAEADSAFVDEGQINW